MANDDNTHNCTCARGVSACATTCAIGLSDDPFDDAEFFVLVERWRGMFRVAEGDENSRPPGRLLDADLEREFEMGDRLSGLVSAIYATRPRTIPGLRFKIAFLWGCHTSQPGFDVALAHGETVPLVWGKPSSRYPSPDYDPTWTLICDIAALVGVPIESGATS